MAITDKEQYSHYAEAKTKAAKKEEAKRIKEIKAVHSAELEKWLKGEGYRMHYRNGRDYLRVNGERVETSQYVQIPMELAKRLYLAVLNNTMKVGDKVVGFSVSSITDTDIVIGCHSFPKKYLIEFGSKL